MRFCFFTLGTRGDVQPYVALAQRAIQQGHSAVVCTGASFSDFVRGHGVEFVPVASDLMAMLDTEEGQMVYHEALKHPIRTKRYVSEVVNPAFRKTLDQFYKAAQGSDLIVYHPKAFGAPDIAETLGIRCVNLPPIPATYPIIEFPNPALVTTRNLGPRLNKLTYTLMKQAESASIKEVNDFRVKTLGLPKRKTGAYTYVAGGREIPIVYPLSPQLFPDVTSWQDKVYLAGFFFLDGAAESLDPQAREFVEAGSPPVVVSFSSLPLKDPAGFGQMLRDALQRSGNRAVVLLGSSGMSFPHCPEILAIPGAPHSALFPLAKGILHHGGIGTLAAALKSGKPQLIMPFAVDQPFWAARMYRLGLAGAPLDEKKLTGEALAQAFLQFDSNEMISKAAEIGRAVAAEDGTGAALAYLENV